MARSSRTQSTFVVDLNSPSTHVRQLTIPIILLPRKSHTSKPKHIQIHTHTISKIKLKKISSTPIKKNRTLNARLV